MRKLSTSLGPGDYDPPDDYPNEARVLSNDTRELRNLSFWISCAAQRNGSVSEIHDHDTSVFVEQITKELDAILDRVLTRIDEM